MRQAWVADSVVWPREKTRLQRVSVDNVVTLMQNVVNRVFRLSKDRKGEAERK